MAIEVVLVGLGPRGLEWARGIQKSSGYNLTACVDNNLPVLNQACAELKLNSESCFDDLERALDETSCQAVVIATDPDAHIEPCRNALGRGLAVMVEKPFTMRLADAVELVTLAESANASLLVAQNYRYMRAFKAAKRLIDEGRLGRVRLADCQYFRPPHEMRESLRRLSHTVLWGVGVHHLDALRYMLGGKVTGVSADIFTIDQENMPSGASMRAMLSFEEGTRATYAATYESSGHEFFERGQEFYARFVGERGTLHVFQRWLIFCESGKLPRFIRRGPRTVSEEQVLLQKFERALLQNEMAEVSGRDNLQTMAIVEACVQSSKNGTWVNPQELLAIATSDNLKTSAAVS